MFRNRVNSSEVLRFSEMFVYLQTRCATELVEAGLRSGFSLWKRLPAIARIPFFRSHEGFWSDGRVARQRSAKPCTAVRIRFRPRKNRVVDCCNAVFLFVWQYLSFERRVCNSQPFGWLSLQNGYWFVVLLCLRIDLPNRSLRMQYFHQGIRNVNSEVLISILRR